MARESARKKAAKKAKRKEEEEKERQRKLEDDLATAISRMADDETQDTKVHNFR